MIISDQKSILSWKCHKFKRKRGYDKWNFTLFRLDCERWQQLLRRCFETLIVSRSLFVYTCSNTTLLELETLLFLFFSKICASKLGVRLIYGCGLYTDVYGSLDHFPYGWILSTMGNFTCSIKGKSIILSLNRCYRLLPLMTGLGEVLGDVCISAKWLIGPELIQVSVAWSD